MMVSMQIAVVGGNGKTGSAVRAALAARGVGSIPVGRGDWADLASVLAGVDAVYLIAPNLHPDEPGLVAEVIDAARAAGLGRLGYHSVAAPYSPAMPHHLGKAAGEDLVRRSGLDWTILQPCAYLQNLLPTAGVIEVPYSIDARFGLVDLADVGEAAAVVLTEPGHVGATYELGGPELVSVAEVAAAVGAEARRISVEQWRADVGDRVDARQRRWLEAMFDYYDQHGLPTGSVPLAALLGRAPRGLAQWGSVIR